MGNLGSVAQLAFFAGREPPPSKLLHNTRGAIGAFEFLVYGTGQRQHLALRQTFAIRRAAAFPRPIAADADIKHIAHFGQRKQLTLRINPGVLHSASFAKYHAALFMISSSRLRRRFSARSRESSISSSVTAFTQLLKVWSPSPSSLQTIPMLCPPLTRLTASSLNSRVDACLVSSISCFPKVTSIIHHPWQTKLRGKVSNAAVQKPSPPGHIAMTTFGVLVQKQHSIFNLGIHGLYAPDLLSTFSQLRPLVQRQLLKFFRQSVEFSNSYHSTYPTDFYTITIDYNLVVT